MADLREERLDESTVLKNIGVDDFGPFIVKTGRKNEKRWCCLFTCLIMRAVRIKVVPNLDTDICLIAFLQFITRKGKWRTLISNNGTNLVGAEQEYVAAWNQEGIEELLIQQVIRWKSTQPQHLTLE